MRSTKPTHGIPLTEAERAFTQTEGKKRWYGGPRFTVVSRYGSKGSNSGSRTPKAARPAGVAKPVFERPTSMPKWAHKYQQGGETWQT